MTIAPTPIHHRHEPHRHQAILISGIVGVIAIVAAGVTLLVQHDVFQGSSGSTSVQGSGVAATQTRSLGTFSSIDLAGSNNVTVSVGAKQAVVVRGDDNLLRYVTTRVQAGGLVIGNAASFDTETPMSVTISVPSLQALTLSGSGTIAARNVHSAQLTVTLSGSGVLHAGGTVIGLDVSLDGSGDAQLGELSAQNVHAVVYGSGRIVVHATDTLDASVPGTGVIVYGGNPSRVTTSVTGSGAISRDLGPTEKRDPMAAT